MSEEKTLNENLSFNYDKSFYKDVNTIDGIVKRYVADRKNLYNELVSDYDENSVEEYYDFFTTYSTDLTQNVWEDMYHIHHFLERDYEIYIQEEIGTLRDAVLSAITERGSYDDFETSEFDRIISVEDKWNEFCTKISDVPVMDLNDMDYDNVHGVQCYYDRNSQDFVMEVFSAFMDNLHDSYPNTLLKLDTVVLVPKDYIHFLGGDDSTQAFFTDNSLFLASSCDDVDNEEECVFFKTVLYHEFGHFIFSLMSETSQIYWANLYKEWRRKGVSMTRDDDRNSQLYDENGNESGENVEELFADTFACRFVGDEMSNDFYIHRPSSLIMDSMDFLLRNEFK